ncbi:MAG: hypothetical protein M1828_003421 [Chrysothrix sp. TS-e1954]|nr:MAG: hypothetical protein M1828_003421 [Chrysothrix sp. TS-e1954]
MGFSTAILPIALLLLPGLNAQNQAPLQPSDAADWATEHMISEHHIGNFDPSSFFALHDYDSDGQWEPQEIRRTYGLAEDATDGMGGGGTNRPVNEQEKEGIVRQVMQLFDVDGNGMIDRSEFVQKSQQGNKLPDFGLGPGHHGDDEYEYEIHHFERFHDENTKEEDLTHPEDIAHFKKHDEMDDAADRQEAQDALRIVVGNIPPKFRRQR